MDVQRTEMRGVSGWIHLRWEGQAMNTKMLGTVGTVGTLARFLGKSVRFSSVPKGANGTLAGGRGTVTGGQASCFDKLSMAYRPEDRGRTINAIEKYLADLADQKRLTWRSSRCEGAVVDGRFSVFMVLDLMVLTMLKFLTLLEVNARMHGRRDWIHLRREKEG
jgi:hypothetical protein